MPKGYLIDGEEPRNIKEIYVGVDGKARRIIRGWVGVNGVARLLARKPGVLTLSRDSVPLASGGILSIPFTTTISILSASGAVSVAVDNPQITATVSGNTITVTVNTTAFKNSNLTVSVAGNVEYMPCAAQIPLYIPTGTVYRQYGTYTENLHDYTSPEQFFTIDVISSRVWGDDQSEAEAVASTYLFDKTAPNTWRTNSETYNCVTGLGSITIDGVTYTKYKYLYSSPYGQDHYYDVARSMSDKVPREDNQQAVKRYRIDSLPDSTSKYLQMRLRQLEYTYGYYWAADPAGDFWTKGSMTYVTPGTPQDGAYFSWTAA